MPFEQCPVLWIDGSPLCESGAIFRYLASEFGLNGANNLQAAYIEMITGVISDAYSKLPIFEKDEEKKVRARTTRRLVVNLQFNLLFLNLNHQGCVSCTVTCRVTFWVILRGLQSGWFSSVACVDFTE